jgi:RNA polymerase sigma-70 factor (ECF subfamily)
VEDLVQDTLVAGLAAGRSDAPWLAGTLRNLAAMQARGAGRRRRREQLAGEMEAAQAPHAGIDMHDAMGGHAAAPCADARQGAARRSAWPDAWQAWPASLRRVAVLALHGLSAQEIRYVVGLGDEAFRQRLSRLRKALAQLSPAQRAESLALAYVRDPARSVDLQFGLVRRALKAALHGRDGMATHDADGHLLIIRRPGVTFRPRAATDKRD